MKFFALYNYMFEKCIDTDDIFNDEERLQEVEENFARRQACFDDVLVDDYTKTQCIHFTNARGTQYLPPLPPRAFQRRRRLRAENSQELPWHTTR